jgi:hypothetical protein
MWTSNFKLEDTVYSVTIVSWPSRDGQPKAKFLPPTCSIMSYPSCLSPHHNFPGGVLHATTATIHTKSATRYVPPNPREWRAGRTWRRDYGKCTDREYARCAIPALPHANISFITEEIGVKRAIGRNCGRGRRGVWKDGPGQ